MGALQQLTFVQIAYATTDVRGSARRLHDLTGAGPFFVRENVPMTKVVVGGEDARFDHTCALGQWGKVMVEFVQHHELAPAGLERAMRRSGAGIHHVASFVDDLEAARDQLVAEGVRHIMDAQSHEVRFMFFDPGPELGHLLELYEETDYLATLYRRVHDAATDWDGSDLFRERT